MNGQNCGNCDHQGYGVEHKKIECLLDREVYEISHVSCENFKKYVQGKTYGTRLAEARDIRREREARAKEQRDRKHTEKMGQMRMKHDKELTLMKTKHDKKLQRTRLLWGGLGLLVGLTPEILRLFF